MWLRSSILAAGVALAALPAAATTVENFEAKTTRDLVELCGAGALDPRRTEAIHFCQGYMIGAWDYHQASHHGPTRKPLVCMPNPAPSRNEAAAMFVAWANENPQYMTERPVESLFRWAIAKWPCPEEPRRARRSR